jgi:hypothetical protein
VGSRRYICCNPRSPTGVWTAVPSCGTETHGVFAKQHAHLGPLALGAVAFTYAEEAEASGDRIFVALSFGRALSYAPDVCFQGH